jgi:hypothetical protein
MPITLLRILPIYTFPAYRGRRHFPRRNTLHELVNAAARNRCQRFASQGRQVSVEHMRQLKAGPNEQVDDVRDEAVRSVFREDSKTSEKTRKETRWSVKETEYSRGMDGLRGEGKTDVRRKNC